MSEVGPSRARRHHHRLASVSGPACGTSLGRGGLAERHVDLGEGLLDRSENGSSPGPSGPTLPYIDYFDYNI